MKCFQNIYSFLGCLCCNNLLTLRNRIQHAVLSSIGYAVVHHLTIVADGHGCLKTFLRIVIGCVLRIAGSSYL